LYPGTNRGRPPLFILTPIQMDSLRDTCLEALKSEAPAIRNLLLNRISGRI
jgi:hypothetical protein